ncbi:hypothetical protein DIPPA_33433 [Diplonema papillatum]|nr:hypothetical protein DIPPA_33433 [Diplonema papillatum]
MRASLKLLAAVVFVGIAWFLMRSPVKSLPPAPAVSQPPSEASQPPAAVSQPPAVAAVQQPSVLAASQPPPRALPPVPPPTAQPAPEGQPVVGLQPLSEEEMRARTETSRELQKLWGVIAGLRSQEHVRVKDKDNPHEGSFMPEVNRAMKTAREWNNRLLQDDARLPPCTSLSQFGDGSFRQLTIPKRSLMFEWAPVTCYHPVTPNDPAKGTCARNLTVMFYGDSVTNGLLSQYKSVPAPCLKKDVIGLTRDGNLVYIVHDPDLPETVPPFAVGLWYQAVIREGSLRSNETVPYIAQADYHVVGGGMHDMGLSHFVPAQVYFEKILETIAYIKSKAKPSAKLVFFILHPLHVATRCPKNLACQRCNHPKKVLAMREAQRLAATCTGAEIFDTQPIMQHMANMTRDGIHLDHTLTIEGELLGTHLCKNLPFPTQELRLECTPENVAAMKKKWTETPEVQRACGNVTL